jgi:hypothetical protein
MIREIIHDFETKEFSAANDADNGCRFDIFCPCDPRNPRFQLRAQWQRWPLLRSQFQIGSRWRGVTYLIVRRLEYDVSGFDLSKAAPVAHTRW